MIVKDGKVWFCLADACKALEIKNPSDVKKRLDSRGLDTIDVSTNSKNRHGEFTHTQIMTFIDEKYWLSSQNRSSRLIAHGSLLIAHYSLLSRVLASSQLFLLRISDIATTVPTKRLTKEVLTLYI